MKPVIARMLSPLCYGVGHGMSVLASWAYDAYGVLMGWSASIEQWAGIEFMWHADTDQ